MIDAARACSPCPVLEPAEAFRQADQVFQGAVVSVEPAPLREDLEFRNVVTLDVQAAWKGVAPGTRRLVIQAAGSMCGPRFRTGQVWVVYTSGKSPLAGACGGSGEVRLDLAPQHASLGPPEWTEPTSLTVEQRFIAAVAQGETAAAAALVDRVASDRLPFHLLGAAMAHCDPGLVGVVLRTGASPTSWSPSHVAPCPDAVLPALLDAVGVENGGLELLWEAVKTDNVDRLRVVLAAGVSASQPPRSNHTPLEEALAAHHLEVAQVLVDAGAPLTPTAARFAKRYPAFAVTLDAAPVLSEPVVLCREGTLLAHDTVALARLIRDGLAPGTCVAHGFGGGGLHDTPLQSAVARKNLAGTALLLAAGADVNEAGGAPLGRAAAQGDLVMVDLLLALGASVNPPWRGEPALHQAVRGGSLAILERLLEVGFDVNTRSGSGETALGVAVRGDEILPVVERLLAAGADPELGHTMPLDSAALWGQTRVVAALLAHGAEPTGPESHALAEAARSGHLEVVRLLLDAGADPRDTWGGKTPRRLAEDNGHPDVAALLPPDG